MLPTPSRAALRRTTRHAGEIKHMVDFGARDPYDGELATDCTHCCSVAVSTPSHRSRGRGGARNHIQCTGFISSSQWDPLLLLKPARGIIRVNCTHRVGTQQCCCRTWELSNWGSAPPPPVRHGRRANFAEKNIGGAANQGGAGAVRPSRKVTDMAALATDVPSCQVEVFWVLFISLAFASRSHF